MVATVVNPVTFPVVSSMAPSTTALVLSAASHVLSFPSSVAGRCDLLLYFVYFVKYRVWLHKGGYSLVCEAAAAAVCVGKR